MYTQHYYETKLLFFIMTHTPPLRYASPSTKE